MSHYKVTVSDLSDTVQVFPSQPRDRDTDLTECCTRIGMMVMTGRITDITVYRDGEVYRKFLRREEEKA